jgi:hypothetical protein
MTKVDDTSERHLTWLVESRSRNQTACIQLFRTIENHSDKLAGTTFGPLAQSLASAAFSLWRSAFLSDVGMRGSALKDAQNFLARIILDNAVNYPQDRAARRWSFFYYLNNAAYHLDSAYKVWPEVYGHGARPPGSATQNPQRLWTYYETALETSVSELHSSLTRNTGPA